MPTDYAKELGAMKPMGGKPMADEGSDYDAGKEAAGRALASALGVDPEAVDGAEVCEAVKAILELEE